MSNKPKRNFLLSKRYLYINIAILLLIGSFYVYFRTNISFREVVDATVYCTRQPSTEELAKWITKYNIKTIINLRGHIDQENTE